MNINLANFLPEYRCPKCGTLLPADAKFCDNCGEACDSQEHRFFEIKRRLVVVLVISVLVAAYIIFRIWLIASTRGLEEEWSLSDVKATVTSEEYDKIELGMTYDEVIEIIGGKGKEVYEDTYYWPGTYYEESGIFSSSAEMSFNDDGKLTQKKENDIVDAEEIKKVRDLLPDNAGRIDAPIVTAKQIDQLEEGMKISEVSKMLGGDGMLYSSESSVWAYDSETDVRKSYAYRCRSRKNDSHIVLHFTNDRLSFKPDKRIIRSIE